MPSSTWVHLSDVLTSILTVQPTSVLDVGVGFGKWGYLCREYLDIGKRRLKPTDWKTTIDGIEPFEEYLQPHQNWLYDDLFVGTVQEWIEANKASEKVQQYDLVIFGDILEHLPRHVALSVLEFFQAYVARKLIVVGIPLGPNWKQGEVCGNELETHVSAWEVDDLKLFGMCYQVYNTFNKPYAATLFYGEDAPCIYIPKGWTKVV